MADRRISELDPAASLVGNELLPLVQGGATVRATAQAIADLAGGGGSGLPNMIPASRYPGVFPSGAAVTNPIADGFMWPGALMDMQGITGYGDAVAPIAAVTPQTANTVRAQPLYVAKSVTLSKIGARVTTLSAGQSLYARLYDTSADGRPGLALHPKVTLSMAATGWVVASFSEITLTPGLYWLLYTFTSTVPRVRGWTAGGRNVWYGGDSVTGLTAAAAAARLDSTDLSLEVWTLVGGVESADSTVNVCAGNFMAA